MKKRLKAYFPHPLFPSVSVTGDKCMLNCPHCEGKYLRHMIKAENLYSLASKFYQEGKIGFLLSGGCDLSGRVPIPWEEVKRIKRDFDLKINVHVGAIFPEEVKKVAESGVDVVSFDYIPEEVVLRRIYGIEREKGWAKRVLKEFEREGVSYAPHITLGLDYGKIWWEFNAVKSLEDMSFHVIIFNVLIPTKGTKMEKAIPPSPSSLRETIMLAKGVLDSEISLGCMRPRNRGYEEVATEEGVERIALPSRKLKKEYITFRYCCAL